MSDPVRTSIDRPVHQALILVGGRGTRLGALTGDTPKPMLEVGGRPFLTTVIQELARQGISEVILLAGYLGEQIAHQYHGRQFGECLCRVLIEPEPLGTGGALRLARDLVQERFLVLNGDSFLRFSLFDLERRQARSGCAHALVGLTVEDTSRYGALDFDGDLLVNIAEKGRSGPGYINCGVYLFDRSVFDHVAASGPQSMERDILPRLMRERRVVGFNVESYFVDIGVVASLEEARAKLTPYRPKGDVFFDRDGVLNVDSGYVHRWEDFEWLPGAQEAVAAVVRSGRRAFVVTNQAGIGRGYYPTDDMLRLHYQMNRALRAEGGWIAEFFHSPHHAEAEKPFFRSQDHPTRKPNAGMLYAAARRWDVDLKASALFGDRDTDVQAAEAAGLCWTRIVKPGDLLQAVKAYLESQ